jgi:phosphate transport system permease protein
MNAAAPPKQDKPAERGHYLRRRSGRRSAGSANSMLAHGEPMVWLCSGALVMCVIMITSLLALVLYEGGRTFWPQPLVQLETNSGTKFLGEVSRVETFIAESGDEQTRRLLRTGNFDLTGTHFNWVNDADIAVEQTPDDALLIERLSWGRFYGFPKAMLEGEQQVATGPQETWKAYKEHHGKMRRLFHERRGLETHEIGAINAAQEKARLAMRGTAQQYGEGSPEHVAAQQFHEQVKAETEQEFARIRAEIQRLNEEASRYSILLQTVDGQEKTMPLSEIVRAVPANDLSLPGKLRVYLSRWWEYLSAEPREANSEGGVFPAIFGTVAMTLIMTIIVVPFGVLAALYLREYAGSGIIVSILRIAINNLAGVPSIVFGVFGLGFFCYFVGAEVDDLFFQERLPNPTYGKGGLLWASLTLALLTLPVVIVATEEALAAVPKSMREGSYACGASKWQTIKRIVLPRAMPGIMTGMILAMARGAGEVAPLMLVGAVKLAPELPIDGEAPFVHPQRSFMHLGFHIYDLGFQSQNSEAAKPMVFTTTLLLIAMVAGLNIAAILIRSRLRKKFEGGSF